MPPTKTPPIPTQSKCRPWTAALLALPICWAYSASAAPYIPTDNSEVLQYVLVSSDPRLRAIRDLGAALAKHPDDLELSLKLASRQLSLGVAESDPHFVGYAEGTLAPWWRDPSPPLKLRVLRARIRQAQHDFAAAKEELRAVLQIDPTQVDARLVLAGISETTGDLDAARQACGELARLRPGLAATACGASVDSVTGHAKPATFALTLATTRARSDDAAVQCWALTILAEIDARREEPAADQEFRDALAASPADVYTLTAYADYLLDHRRPAEVAHLLAGKERIDALLLRLALAAQESGDSKLEGYVADLAGRYQAAWARGGALHYRDESRFELELRGNAPRALELARLNWDSQRTPLDARIYLAAALAAHDRRGVDVIADWVARTGLEDNHLLRMLDQKDAAL